MITDPTPEGILATITGLLGPMFEQFAWADQEIAAATARHPDKGDLLWHASPLLFPTHDLMAGEMVFRGHCAELLARVAKGEDTRPGTAAEVAIACSGASLVAPPGPALNGLYHRMWLAAFPDHPLDGDPGIHAEAVRRAEWSAGVDEINALERTGRRRLTRPDRVLDPAGIDCTGIHDGAEVDCQFAPAGRGALF